MTLSAIQRLPETLQFALSHEHPCSYLPGQQACYLAAVPEHSDDGWGGRLEMDMATYSALAELGFRRSGEQVYRPHCPACDACRPVRIPVAQFRPNRSQRRAARANADLEVVLQDDGFREEHFALYRRYQASRHTGDAMDSDDAEQYHRFLTCSWCDTRFVEFRHQGRLLAVAVVDVLEHGLSAVYTFFDPDEATRGLGTAAVLWQIEECRRRDLPHLYLGFWIAGCRKMAYKSQFRPLEQFHTDGWQPLAETR